ncbi:ATP-dependent Clp protease adapter ClpS [Arthrobacter sp. KK5.5]|uniref:ATP-dependent Clp protease adapter ClpS n=1 Tax=Arthrobacter sp. KK5.5 TaxID=3373084 RepID=UPI003EE45E42
MPVITAQTDVLPRAETEGVVRLDVPYVLIVWNDPVNLMSYVSFVFRSHFGYSEAKADALMLEVHQAGRSVVATGTREKIETDVAAMHGFGLWATLQRADES